MATRTIAFSTNKPAPDVMKLYEEKVVSHELDKHGDEVCIPFDVDEYVLSGFDKKRLAVKREKTSHKSLLAKLFVRKETASAPLEDALASRYIPDMLVLEDGNILEDNEDGTWPNEYRQALATAGGAFVTFALNHI